MSDDNHVLTCTRGSSCQYSTGPAITFPVANQLVPIDDRAICVRTTFLTAEWPGIEPTTFQLPVLITALSGYIHSY